MGFGWALAEHRLGIGWALAGALAEHRLGIALPEKQIHQQSKIKVSV